MKRINTETLLVILLQRCWQSLLMFSETDGLAVSAFIIYLALFTILMERIIKA